MILRASCKPGWKPRGAGGSSRRRSTPGISCLWAAGDFPDWGRWGARGWRRRRAVCRPGAWRPRGGRGLMTVCGRVFRDFKFELPSTSVRQFVVARDLVDRPGAVLQDLLVEHRKEERGVMRQLVAEFGQRFRERHGLNLLFSDGA